MHVRLNRGQVAQQRIFPIARDAQRWLCRAKSRLQTLCHRRCLLIKTPQQLALLRLAAAPLLPHITVLRNLPWW